jgi:hypothetical protein
MPADRVELFTGGRGMGKTSLLLASLAGYSRILVWSPLEQRDHYARRLNGKLVRNLSQLMAALAAAPGRTPAVIVYHPQAVAVDCPEFTNFCRAVFAWGHCAAVVEELATVTHTGKAPQWWGRLLREGRGEPLHVEIFATTQRPQECDKTILGNVTRTCAFRLKRQRDRELMAGEMGLDVSLLHALPPYEWYETDDYGTVTHGRLTKA